MTILSFGKAVLVLNPAGAVTSLLSETGDRLIAGNLPPQPFLQVGFEGKLEKPVSAVQAEGQLIFSFANGETAVLSVENREAYTVFTVTEISERAEMIAFGPIFTCLTSEIGDTVGVVQGEKWAVGIQGLNIKTQGGFPEEFAADRSEAISEKILNSLYTSVDKVVYYNSAAFPAEYQGEKLSVLQLHCENRCRTRVKAFLHHRPVEVPPMEDVPDAHICGAKFALFCTEKENALDVIGKIETECGLPHPVFHGEWMKKSKEAKQSYLITVYDPKNIGEILDWTERAGYHYVYFKDGYKRLYYSGPFRNGGHFELRPDCFPEGNLSLKKICDTAAERGIRVGLHILPPFITPNDPYVTPVPDERLVTLGHTLLTCGIGEEDTEISTAETDLFTESVSLNCVRIGQELIRYFTFENNTLTRCERGAFGTRKSAHEAGEPVDLLCDYPYRTLFPGLGMQKEISRRLGQLIKETGVGQMSMDGLEGCTTCGEDWYAADLCRLSCWNDIRRPDMINDASRLTHFSWHMSTRMNWGEPWRAKMREGMTAERIVNQDYFRRNLMPSMMGWFLCRTAERKFEATSLDDIEWMESFAAGCDSGYAFVVTPNVFRNLGNLGELFDKIREWETLRHAGAFSEELRKELKKPETEWHLEQTETPGEFHLFPMFISGPLSCELSDLLEPMPEVLRGTSWTVDHPYADQPYELRLYAAGTGTLSDPCITTPAGTLQFRCTLEGGQYLLYKNGKAQLADRNFHLLRDVECEGTGILLHGRQNVAFRCNCWSDDVPDVTLKLFTYGEPDTVSAEKK